MKKILIICFTILFLTGCSNSNAKDPVLEYLNKFKNHNPEVIASLDELLTLESITIEQKNLYQLIMKKQYSDLEYKVISEKYNGDESEIDVLLTVYDYAKDKQQANKEFLTNPNLYPTEESKMNYQLKLMENETSRINYTLTFKVHFQDNNWVLITPNTEVLEKIHGIYEYEKDD